MATKTKAKLKSIDRDTLWDRAYHALKTALLAGRFAPGERIVLRTIANDLGISLTPVRDAVNRLIAENVLDRGGVGQGGGAIVPLLTAKQFSQLMMIRSSLEPIATIAATELANKNDVLALTNSLEKMKQSIAKGKVDDYLDAHYQFHFGIYRLANLPIILQMIESAWLRCGPTLMLALPDYAPGTKRQKFHIAALRALKKGDVEAAAEAIRADIESARIDVCKLLN
jgi:DNA-binding GntR family transcriptional regulator